MLGVLGVPLPRDHRSEFVRRQKPEGVFLAQARFQTCGHGQQPLIAKRVPKALIDVLELIQLDDQYRPRAALTLRAIRSS